MAELIMENVQKNFDGVAALTGINAHISDGEFVALLGPSGCGKTTLLRLLAGFEKPTEGQLKIGKEVVASTSADTFLPPEERNIGIVFQSYALWPHMSVKRNISYPLEVRRLPREERTQKVQEALALTELEAYADRSPATLSGGQRQRVALARCLVTNPQAVLLDEPLANLDLALRSTMQEAFTHFHHRTGATMIYVTHDQTEAMAMADRVAVMEKGAIRQFASPEQLYNEPENSFVADFVGEGTVVSARPTEELRHNQIGMQLFGQTYITRAKTTTPTHVCIRPEHLRFSDDAPLRAKVRNTTYLGGKFRVKLETMCGHILVALSPDRLQNDMAIGLDIVSPWAFSDNELQHG
ncbi:ABC transporter ATP-binding protein [Kiloniella majae]|uniref:ABC transporter ATP-binding protein n=1 Tax=Kiloniella majae TaxID=1938558 RepID=UPI000A277349|nr:ABC transporter ATP-binding protein [Kiloniella majae]